MFVHKTSTTIRNLPENSMYSLHPMAHGNGLNQTISLDYPGHRDMTPFMLSWTASLKWLTLFPPIPQQLLRILHSYTSNMCESTMEFPRYITPIGQLYSWLITPEGSSRDSISINSSPPLITHSHRVKWRTITSGSRPIFGCSVITNRIIGWNCYTLWSLPTITINTHPSECHPSWPITGTI